MCAPGIENGQARASADQAFAVDGERILGVCTGRNVDGVARTRQGERFLNRSARRRPGKAVVAVVAAGGHIPRTRRTEALRDGAECRAQYEDEGDQSTNHRLSPWGLLERSALAGDDCRRGAAR